MMTNVPDYFGCMVFNDQKMKARLPHVTYKALKKTIQNGEPLDLSVANAVANAMKDWAVEMGCTHYTHWFQPMTGVTAEKHDSFITPDSDGQVIMEFSGKGRVSLPAASALPSRPEATPHGTRLLRRSSEIRPSIFLQRSVPIPARCWIRKRRCCVRWNV